MTTQIATQINGHSLVELCKTGGLQDIYQVAVDASNEIVDVRTKKGRTRARSLAAQVASSKTLFVKACRAHLADQKILILDGEKEIRDFVKAMDKLRDDTKEPAIMVERRLDAELKAYVIAGQMSIDAQRAAEDAKQEAMAMLFAHMEAKEQNRDFEDLNIDASIAKFHFENKERNIGKVFDSETWIKAQNFKEKMDNEFVMPGYRDPDQPIITVQPFMIEDTYNSDSPSFQTLAAAENMHTATGINEALALKLIEAIQAGKINSVEWVG